MNMIVWKHLLSRRWTILRCDLFTRGYVEPLRKYLGAPNKDLLVTKELENYSLYNSLDSLKEMSSALIKRLEKQKNFGKQIYKDCLSSCKSLVYISKEVSYGNLKTLKNEDLLNRLKKYFDIALDFTVFLALPANYEVYVTGEIKRFIIENVGPEESEKVLQKLMSAKQHPHQVLEQVDLSRIALKIKNKTKVSLNNALKKHKLRYQWLSCYNFDENEFSIEDFKERLEALLDLGLEELKSKTLSVQNKLKVDEKEFQKTIKELKIPAKLLDKINLLREFVFLRTYRIEMNSQSNYYLRPLLNEIASRGNISVAQLSMMLPQEIEIMLQENHVPKSINFKERKNTAIFWLENCIYKYAFGDKAKKIISKMLVKSLEEKVSIIRGTTASLGDTVQGKVRILNKFDLKDFQRGEVLVSTMTSPEFVPAMHKAVAIVTDEGGVLCHAAIVSREMNKPCITGAKIATKVLKNGDLVEVNTKESIIRIL